MRISTKEPSVVRSLLSQLDATRAIVVSLDGRRIESGDVCVADEEGKYVEILFRRCDGSPATYRIEGEVKIAFRPIFDWLARAFPDRILRPESA